MGKRLEIETFMKIQRKWEKENVHVDCTDVCRCVCVCVREKEGDRERSGKYKLVMPFPEKITGYYRL